MTDYIPTRRPQYNIDTADCTQDLLGALANFVLKNVCKVILSPNLGCVRPQQNGCQDDDLGRIHWYSLFKVELRAIGNREWVHRRLSCATRPSQSL